MNFKLTHEKIALLVLLASLTVIFLARILSLGLANFGSASESAMAAFSLPDIVIFILLTFLLLPAAFLSGVLMLPIRIIAFGLNLSFSSFVIQTLFIAMLIFVISINFLYWYMLATVILTALKKKKR